MSPRLTSPKNPDASEIPTSVKTRINNLPSDILPMPYKGGRKLLYAERFRIWREVQSISRADVAQKLSVKARSSRVRLDERYLADRIEEFENGRHKPPTWLVMLLQETYEIRIPWAEFFDGGQQ